MEERQWWTCEKFLVNPKNRNPSNGFFFQFPFSENNGKHFWLKRVKAFVQNMEEKNNEPFMDTCLKRMRASVMWD